MSLEFDEKEEPKDRTKLIWLGVFGLVVVMVAVLWVAGRPKADVSRVRAKHILIKCDRNDPVDRARALETINDLRRRIQGGERFEKLAKEFSNDEFSSARGGDLGYQDRGTFEPEFEEFVWNGPLKELSDIIQTTYGFHLIITVDRHLSKADEYEMKLEKKAVDSGEKLEPPRPPGPPKP